MPARILRIYVDSFAGLERRVWMLAAATLINRSGSMVLPFLSLYLTRHLEYSALEAGRIVALYGVGAVLGSYLGGWLSDRVDPIRVLAGSLLASAVGFLALIKIQSFLGFAVAVTLTSTVAEGFRPALMVAVALTCRPETRTRSFALIRLAANLGMSVGPALGGILAVRGYGWLFFCDALTCSAAAVFVLMKLGRAGSSRTSTETPAPSSDKLEPARPAERPRGEPDAGSPWKDLPFLAFCGLVVAMATALFQIWTTFPLYLRSVYRLSEAAIGPVLALNAGLIALFEMPLLRAVERRRMMPLISVGALLTCAGMGLLPLGSGLAMAAASTVVWTVGEMLELPFTNTIVAERAPAGSTGRYMGMFTLTFSIAFIIAPIVGTAVYEGLGPSALWYGVAAFGLLLWLGFTLLAPAIERSRPAGAGVQPPAPVDADSGSSGS